MVNNERKGPSAAGTKAPKVNKALGVVKRNRDLGSADALAMEELDALKSQLAVIRASVGEIAPVPTLARSIASEAREELENRVVERPFAAVAIAALVGYVWGMKR